MKQIITLVALAVVAAGFSSCKKEKITDSGIKKEQVFTFPATFGTVNNNGKFNVTIVPSTSQKVVVQADAAVLSEMDVEVQNSKLSLHYKNNRREYEHSPVSITIFTTPLNEITIAGSGTISSDVTLTGGLQLLTDVSGSGNLNLLVDYPVVKTNISGSGTITVKGKSTSAEHTVSGSGKIKAYELVSLEAVANISGSGSMQVAPVNKLTAIVSGSGSIYYKGNPVATISKSGRGDVVHE